MHERQCTMHHHQHPVDLSQDGYPYSMSGQKAPSSQLCTMHRCKEKTVRLFYPSTPQGALASCTTSVYVNLSKNSFFMQIARIFGRKRMQRYEKYKYKPNFYPKNYLITTKFSELLTKQQYTLLYNKEILLLFEEFLYVVLIVLQCLIHK